MIKEIERKIVSVIFQVVDDAIMEDKFDDVGRLLYEIKLEDYSLKVLIGFLSVTNPHKDKIDTREFFLNKVREKMNKEVGVTRTDKVLKGLV